MWTEEPVSARPKVSSPAFRRRKSIDARELGAMRRLVLKADRLLSEMGEVAVAFERRLLLRGVGRDVELNERVNDVLAGTQSIPAALAALNIGIRYPASVSRKPRRGSRVKGKGQGSRGAR
jgi:hypothetical protein